jgi:hypothetical protein
MCGPATRVAVWLKNWRKELGDQTFARQKAPLRLRYAIEDVTPQRPTATTHPARNPSEDRSFGGGRLRNLGVAVGVSSELRCCVCRLP